MTNYFNMFLDSEGEGASLYTEMMKEPDQVSMFNDIYNRYIYRYEQRNLPETCSPRFLENALFFRGKACFIKDKQLDFLTLFANCVGMPTVYGEWTKILATGANGYNKEYKNFLETGDNKNANCVLIRENASMFPPMIYAALFTGQLCEIRRTILTTSRKLRNPYLILSDVNISDSINKILKKSEAEGSYAVVASKKLLDKDIIQLFNTNIDSTALNVLWDTYDKFESQLKTQMGEVSVNNPDKKERMLVDEVNANNETTNIHDDIGLVWRKMACDQINKLQGLNVDVELRKPVDENYENDTEEENLQEVTDELSNN